MTTSGSTIEPGHFLTERDCEARELLRAKLNLETARIGWGELQRFFAMGKTVAVSADLDLVEVGLGFAEDDRTAVAALLEQGSIAPVTDAQARQWLARPADLWCLVVRPWVLVQDRP